MANELPRTRFNRSGLVRALADVAVVEVPESRQSLAERLGQWLDFKDALPLYSVLNAGAEPAAATGSATPGTAAAREDLARVRALLSDSIRADGLTQPGKSRIALPVPLPNASIDSAAEYSPFHRYYLAHQRDMNANIGPLRANVRAVLTAQTPALRQLAALDAVLEQAFLSRERSLLATIPAQLEKRFEQLYATHQAAQADGGGVDEPDKWMQPGGWMAAFCAEMQAVLLAELALRLQPIVGMIDAIDNEVAKEQ